MDLSFNAKVVMDALNVFGEQPVKKAASRTLRDIIAQIVTASKREYRDEYNGPTVALQKIRKGRTPGEYDLSASMFAEDRGRSLGWFKPEQEGARLRRQKGEKSKYILKVKKGYTERGLVSVLVKGRKYLSPDHFLIAPKRGGRAVMRRVAPGAGGLETAMGPGPELVVKSRLFMMKMNEFAKANFEKKFMSNLSYYMGGVIRK